MFLEFFGLREHAFGVTPDPRYLYLSPTHRETLASLVYGVEAGRGFLGLIAPPGMGKTTLLFQLLQRLGSTARTVFLFQTQCDPKEFFRSLLADLGVEDAGNDMVQMHGRLNNILLHELHCGRRFVLVIDEAQNLDEKVLEVVRMLSNFETPRAKLMQIVLAGQPQLADKLARPSLTQLRQRISMVCRLRPLNPEETGQYIAHRLDVAGYSGPPLFTEGALRLIAEASKGIPRNINNYCFNALSLACANETRLIDQKILMEVLSDLDINQLQAEDPAPEAGKLPLMPELQAPAPVVAVDGWACLLDRVAKYEMEQRELTIQVQKSVASALPEAADTAQSAPQMEAQPAPQSPPVAIRSRGRRTRLHRLYQPPRAVEQAEMSAEGPAIARMEES